MCDIVTNYKKDNTSTDLDAVDPLQFSEMNPMGTRAGACVQEQGPVACWLQRAHQWRAAAHLSKEADDRLQPQHPPQETLVG